MNPKERYYSGVARETIHRITANREKGVVQPGDKLQNILKVR